MGYPYAELVAPAILLNNPGLTKEEFAGLLDETRSSDFREFSQADPWDSHDEKDPRQKGLEGLADALSLQLRPEIWTLMETRSQSERTPFKDLYDQYPPETKYDFAKERGNFRVVFNRFDFLWLNRDGRYYLDPEMLDSMPISFRSSGWNGYGYTDLVVTAEAIKHQAWKVLSRRGRQHIPAFFRDFPDSYDRYSRAVFDAEASFNARNRAKNHTELLRMRLGVYA